MTALAGSPSAGAIRSWAPAGRFPGLRPVLFHSPYEAAAWGILAQRRHRTQAAALRRRLAEAHGTLFTLAGSQPLAAFPTPAQLLDVRTFGGLDPVRISRLHAIADAALAGQLDPAWLAGLEPDAAPADIQTLAGLGPTYAGLVLLRAGASPTYSPAPNPGCPTTPRTTTPRNTTGPVTAR